MPRGKNKTEAERSIIESSARNDRTLADCNRILRGGNFDAIPATSYQFWTRPGFSYLVKLNTSAKVRRHIKSPHSLYCKCGKC
jgi:hypothetical protein